MALFASSVEEVGGVGGTDDEDLDGPPTRIFPSKALRAERTHTLIIFNVYNKLIVSNTQTGLLGRGA